MKEESSVEMKTQNGQSYLRRGGGMLWSSLHRALAAFDRDAWDQCDLCGGMIAAAADEARAALGVAS